MIRGGGGVRVGMSAGYGLFHNVCGADRIARLLPLHSLLDRQTLLLDAVEIVLVDHGIRGVLFRLLRLGGLAVIAQDDDVLAAVLRQLEMIRGGGGVRVGMSAGCGLLHNACGVDRIARLLPLHNLRDRQTFLLDAVEIVLVDHGIVGVLCLLRRGSGGFLFRPHTYDFHSLAGHGEFAARLREAIGQLPAGENVGLSVYCTLCSLNVIFIYRDFFTYSMALICRLLRQTSPRARQTGPFILHVVRSRRDICPDSVEGCIFF